MDRHKIDCIYRLLVFTDTLYHEYRVSKKKLILRIFLTVFRTVILRSRSGSASRFLKNRNPYPEPDFWKTVIHIRNQLSEKLQSGSGFSFEKNYNLDTDFWKIAIRIQIQFSEKSQSGSGSRDFKNHNPDPGTQKESQSQIRKHGKNYGKDPVKPKYSIYIPNFQK